MCCGETTNDGSICACDVKYTGGKLTCNGQTLKNCMDMNQVVQTMMKMHCKPVVLYSHEEIAGGSTPTAAVLDNTTYTVPTTDLGGEYEVDYTFDAEIALTGAVHTGTATVALYKNDAVVSALFTTRTVSVTDATSSNGDTHIIPGRFFISAVGLSPGDKIDLRCLKSAVVTIKRAVLKVTKTKHN